nr:unnamed protein product [Callosobruchus chinensis]
MSETLGRCCKGVIKNLDAIKESELIGKLERFASYPMKGLVEDLSPEKAGECAVFCHGDSWTNNFLFAYQIEQAEKLLINEDREYIERRIEEILQRADEKKYD